MLTLPPAQTLGAALVQSVGGALLTMLAICAPVMGLWLLCLWIERHLPPDPPSAATPVAIPDPSSAALPPSALPPAALPPAALPAAIAEPTLMQPLTLSDVELANRLGEAKTKTEAVDPAALIETAPALRALRAAPSSPSSPSSPSRQQQRAEQEQQLQRAWQRAWDNWPPRGKPGQYPYRYIFVGSELVRVASLSRYIAADFQPYVWN